MKRKKKPSLPNELLTDLKDYLAANHIAQEDAAREIGVSYVTLNRWMNGHTVKLTNLAWKAVRDYLDRGTR